MARYMIMGEEIGNAPNTLGIHTGESLSKLITIPTSADKVGNKYGVEDLDNLTKTFTKTILSTDWVANTDTDTSSAYPYVCSIETTGYTDASIPVWHMIGVNGVPTEDEQDVIDMVKYAVFSTAGIKLYADDQPSVDVVLQAKGA